MKRSNRRVKVVAGTMMFVAVVMVLGVFGVVRPAQAGKSDSCQGLLRALESIPAGTNGYTKVYEKAVARGCAKGC